jgi:hypothetical protein
MPWMELSKGWERKRQEIVDRYDLPDADLQALRIYNQERARGLTHTPEWQYRMAGIQTQLDQRKADLDVAFRQWHQQNT